MPIRAWDVLHQLGTNVNNVKARDTFESWHSLSRPCLWTTAVHTDYSPVCGGDRGDLTRSRGPQTWLWWINNTLLSLYRFVQSKPGPALNHKEKNSHVYNKRFHFWVLWSTFDYSWKSMTTSHSCVLKSYSKLLQAQVTSCHEASQHYKQVESWQKLQEIVKTDKPQIGTR